VVNNAGYSLSGDTENATEEEARAEMDTIFWGTVRVMKHALRVMREENAETGQRGGVVMNVTSLGGFLGVAGGAFYHAAKFAVEGFTESVAKEVRPEWNIHFCIVEPGGVQTNYATTSMAKIKPHPAYDFPDSPSRVLEAYRSDPKKREAWALPGAVAGAMVELVSRGRRIPIRIPMGADAWGMMKAELGLVARDLDEFRELSEAVGNPDQLRAVDFLSKAQ